MGDCRKWWSEEVHGLYLSPNVITVMKSRIMTWVGQVARKERRKMHPGFWWGNRRKEIT
jgi:hypothetical protein